MCPDDPDRSLKTDHQANNGHPQEPQPAPAVRGEAAGAVAGPSVWPDRGEQRPRRRLSSAKPGPRAPPIRSPSRALERARAKDGRRTTETVPKAGLGFMTAWSAKPGYPLLPCIGRNTIFCTINAYHPFCLSSSAPLSSSINPLWVDARGLLALW